MKRVTSVVWQFFDRLEKDNRCVAVLCKLCDSEYKYFGNTTNLRVHLINKHPIQWDLRQVDWDGQKSLDEPALRTNFDDDESTNQSTVSPKRRKYTRTTKDKNVDVLENSDAETDHRDNEESEATINLVRQMHNTPCSDEEWLEEDYNPIDAYEPKSKRVQKKVSYRKIKREVVTPPRARNSTGIQRVAKPENTPNIIINDRKDEYSVFGEYIANKLRKFKTPRTRGNIQQIITTILWQAEYGVYDDPGSVRRLLMESVQEVDPVQDHVTNENETEFQTTEADKHITIQNVNSEELPLIN